MLNEGIGSAVGNLSKQGLGAIKHDVLKGSGYEQPFDTFMSNLLNFKKNKHTTDDIKKYKEIIPDYPRKEKEYSIYKQLSSKHSIDDVLRYLNDVGNREELFAFYRWVYYIKVYQNNKKEVEARNDVISDVMTDIKNDKIRIEEKHYKEIQRLVDENIIQKVKKNKASFDSQIKKISQIPKKECAMSFKQFLEEKEKKIKEGLLSGGPVDPAAATNPGKAREVKVKSTKASIDAAKADKSKADLAKSQAALSADAASKAKQLEEGVYAGADGVKKKIPFTQDPNLKDQAVGPKPEKNKDDEYQTAMDKRKKDLEEITKKLQKLADEACEVAKDNIDPTEDNLIDKMAAKERSDLKEGETSWAEMEKNLEVLDEGCIGGVCTMGGRSNDAGGAIGNMGISPMGSIGLSMPTAHMSQPSPNQVADRSSIYNFIKSNDLDKTSRDYALNTLLTQFGNASTELSTILSDAILSDGSPADIDRSYGYSDSSLKAIQDPVEDEIPDGGIDHSNDGLNSAWATMEDTLKDL